MKRIAFTLILGASLLTSVAVKAQKTAYYQADTLRDHYGNSLDTVTNTGTASDSIIVKYTYATAEFQVVVTKISGTIGGTAILQGSLDGHNWCSTGADTLTLANVTTNTFAWPIPGRKIITNSAKITSTSASAPYDNPQALPYLYYRILLTGTGTMSASFRGYAVFRYRN